jgi:septum formation protein
MGLILASASPRRRELLTMLGLSFAVMPAEGERDPGDLTPGAAVEAIALGKALEIAGKIMLRQRRDIVIAADTLVYLDGAPLGKPRDAADAARMLRRLAGRWHEVFTGFAVLGGGAAVTRHERTRVNFRDVTDGEIARYVATGEPLDKAGAYGAQGRGAVFIAGIEGDFFNVMGLPLCALSAVLRDEFGFSIV